MANRIRVGVVFGGRSAEHEVSLVSATSVINALDRNKYEVIPIGISHEGRWLSSGSTELAEVGEALRLLKERVDIRNQPEHILVPDPRKQGLVPLQNSGTAVTSYAVDVVFPVLHGPFGEDGTIQGLFELADVPYVGSGVLGSAVGMDKVIQKQLLRQAKLPVAPDIWFPYDEFARGQKKIIASIEKKLRYPCFVKPPNMGSSVGISKAHTRGELITAIHLAGEFDRKILVERGISKAREIECSVLGNEEPMASVPGEIIPSNEFYDYDAKYVDGKSKAEIPAKLTKAAVKRIQDYSVRAFKALDCAGMARVDFLVQRGGAKIYLNEVNTIPGFTSISMYPKLWQASGLSYPELLDKLITLALQRHEAKKKLKTTYQPKAEWFK